MEIWSYKGKVSGLTYQAYFCTYLWPLQYLGSVSTCCAGKDGFPSSNSCGNAIKENGISLRIEEKKAPEFYCEKKDASLLHKKGEKRNKERAGTPTVFFLSQTNCSGFGCRAG